MSMHVQKKSTANNLLAYLNKKHDLQLYSLRHLTLFDGFTMIKSFLQILPISY